MIPRATATTATGKPQSVLMGRALEMARCPLHLRRVRARLERDDATGCLLYRGYIDSHGYGRYSGILIYVLLWVSEHGPVPAGYLLHHDCRQPLCGNTAHLLPVTPVEHARLHSDEGPGESREGWVPRWRVDVLPSIHQAIKDLAAADGVTATDEVVRAVREWLKTDAGREFSKPAKPGNKGPRQVWRHLFVYIDGDTSESIERVARTAGSTRGAVVKAALSWWANSRHI